MMRLSTNDKICKNVIAKLKMNMNKREHSLTDLLNDTLDFEFFGGVSFFSCLPNGLANQGRVSVSRCFVGFLSC